MRRWTECSDCGFNLGQGHELTPPVTEQVPAGADCPRCGEPMVEVVPLSEVREALEAEIAKRIGYPEDAERGYRNGHADAARGFRESIDAAFPSDSEEGQR